MALWGIDCLNPLCKHDTLRGYRLRLTVLRGRLCMICGREAEQLPPVEMPGGPPDTKVMRCKGCDLRWRNDYVRERNDMVFRETEIDAALSQMAVLGAKDATPEQGIAWLVENHRSLPPGFQARMLVLLEEPLPRIAMYFRWHPESGEMLTPDKVFQCEFPPGARARDRRTAPARTLSGEQFNTIFRHEDQGYVTSMSMLTCQHCKEPLPLRTFSTLTLRACDLGD